MLSRVRQLFPSRVPELAPRDAYRLWSGNYPPYAHNLLMQVEQAQMLDVLPDVRGKLVLDVACGTGRYAHILQERGARTLAFDFSYEMLEHSIETFPRTQADMLALPLQTASIELIVCGLAVGHVENLTGALQEMTRVLTPGGTLIYSDFYATGQARGWKRTFQAGDNSKKYAVRHYPRTEQAHRRALDDAGLRTDSLHVVGISPELARTDARAKTFRAKWGDTPVALVIRAQKL